MSIVVGWRALEPGEALTVGTKVLARFGPCTEWQEGLIDEVSPSGAYYVCLTDDNTRWALLHHHLLVKDERLQEDDRGAEIPTAAQGSSIIEVGKKVRVTYEAEGLPVVWYDLEVTEVHDGYFVGKGLVMGTTSGLPYRISLPTEARIEPLEPEEHVDENPPKALGMKIYTDNRLKEGEAIFARSVEEYERLFGPRHTGEPMNDPIDKTPAIDLSEPTEGPCDHLRGTRRDGIERCDSCGLIVAVLPLEGAVFTAAADLKAGTAVKIDTKTGMVVPKWR